MLFLKGCGVMLRIKKDIDLKELEKFGFEKDEDDYIYNMSMCNQDGDDVYEIEILVDIKTKEIETNTYKAFDYVDDAFLNSLINEKISQLAIAGLVEKVEE